MSEIMLCERRRVIGLSGSQSVSRNIQLCSQSAFSQHREDRREEERMYSEVSLPGKGCGVVASRDIRPGELIIAESPLIILPWWVRHSMFPGIPPRLDLTVCSLSCWQGKETLPGAMCQGLLSQTT